MTRRDHWRCCCGHERHLHLGFDNRGACPSCAAGECDSSPLPFL